MMNNNYSCSVVIERPVTAVYDALTTAAGLRGWWTATCAVGKRVGAESTFRFGPTYNVMHIETLCPDVEVRWRCVKQHHHSPGQLTQVNEWVGTIVAFHLTPQTPRRTLLRFEHIGLRPQLECYKICENGWNHFITKSLKNYVESGQGEPFVEATPAQAK